MFIFKLPVCSLWTPATHQTFKRTSQSRTIFLFEWFMEVIKDGVTIIDQIVIHIILIFVYDVLEVGRLMSCHVWKFILDCRWDINRIAGSFFLITFFHRHSFICSCSLNTVKMFNQVFRLSRCEYVQMISSIGLLL